jgi:hypothetical protein
VSHAELAPVVAYVAEDVLDRLEDRAGVGRVAGFEEVDDAAEREEVEIALRDEEQGRAAGVGAVSGGAAAGGGDDFLREGGGEGRG